MQTFKLLDTTLRDGSYSIDFRFTASDVENISIGLEDAGVKFIEIGHGMGLGASRQTNYKAVCTDEEYFQAVQGKLKKAKYGMFCIPGIANLDDVRFAAEYGSGFIRIGSNVDNVEDTCEFILEAKKYGMLVAANYMKSYTVSPEVFASKVKLSASCGADCVYIVDSAGGMFYSDIKKYVEAVRSVSDISIGFHGHNNLGLAVANSLYCITDLNLDIIDVSLAGIGRSAGNAATELVLSAIMKMDLTIDIDLYKILNLSQEYIHPIMKTGVIKPIDIICGYSGFHTSYMNYIMKCADKYRVDPLKLIVAYCKYSQSDMDYHKLCEIAASQPKQSLTMSKYRFNDYVGNEQDRK